MTAQLDVEALLELLERATPGPWRFKQHREDSPYLGNVIGSYGPNERGIEQIRTISVQTRYEGAHGEALNNAALTVAAVNALPALLAHISGEDARVAAAVAGERERCALLAETDAASCVPMMNGVGYGPIAERNRHKAMTCIAAAIRETPSAE